MQVAVVGEQTFFGVPLPLFVVGFFSLPFLPEDRSSGRFRKPTSGHPRDAILIRRFLICGVQQNSGAGASRGGASLFVVRHPEVAALAALEG
jgi:hypothetical protein